MVVVLAWLSCKFIMIRVLGLLWMCEREVEVCEGHVVYLNGVGESFQGIFLRSYL